MSPDQYAELFEAILNLRDATAFGFKKVDRRFDRMEEHWDRQFKALENRMQDGFATVQASLGAIEARISVVEQHGL